MAYPSIMWTDDAGDAVLSSRAPTFNQWLPDAEDVQAAAETLAAGDTFAWQYRRDYTVHIEIIAIPASDLALALRLKLHLMNGGQVTIDTADTTGAIYTAKLKPKSKPSVALTDRVLYEYTAKLDLLNTAAAPMIAVWG